RAAELRRQLEACYARLWHRHAAGVRRAEPGRMIALERRALELEGRLRRLASEANPPRDPASPEREGTPPPGPMQPRYFCAGGMLGAIRTDVSGPRLFVELAPIDTVSREIRFLHYQMEVLGSPASELRRHHERAAHRAQGHLRSLSQLLLVPLLGRPPWPRE